MKKKIISFMLAMVMVLLAVPATVLMISAVDVAEYRSTVTAGKIEVDGFLDTAYKDSQKITSSYWGTGNSSSLSFEAYTAVSVRGVYVWAEIKDKSLVKDPSHPARGGDKFQIYIRMNNGTEDVWGWYDTDYNGDFSKTIMAGSLGDAEYATVKLPDGSGWRSETFIPFEGSLAAVSIDLMNIYIGLQANNATYSNGSTTNTAYCYDKDARSPYYYTANDLYSPLDLFVNNDVVLKSKADKVVAYTSAATVDGIKDAIYSEHSKYTLGCVIKDSTYTGSDTRTDLGTVYLAFSNYYLYIYYETEDKDLNSKDYFQVYYEMENGNTPISGYFCSKIDPAGSRVYGSTGSNYGYPGSPIESSTLSKNFKQAAKALGDNKYGLEFQIPLSSAVRSAMKTGDAKIKLDFSANDYASDGARKCYGGCTPNSVSMYNYNSFGHVLTYAVLNRSFTDANPGMITGANIVLGSDITVNYYAFVGLNDVYNAYMRFTQNGRTYIAYPKKSEYIGEYRFSFEGVAPQTIGDNIKAELVVDNVIVSTHDNYSVLQNCLNIYNDEKYGAAEFDNMRMLIKGLLNYSAAAQKYASYDTDKLVNDGFEMDLSSPVESDSIKSKTSDISSSIKITAAGVYFGNTNRIYAKFTAPSLSGISVSINGYPAAISASNGEVNTYIVYSDAIPVTRFASEYRIILTSGTKTQTVVYSINSYAYSMLVSENPAMVELARAMYTYGTLAKKYADHGTVSYKVMTFNDGDNSYARVSEVSAIINDYKPDVVGMQEVQKKHTQSTNMSNLGNTYKNKLTDYTVVYFDKDEDNHDVPVIYYRTEKFTLVDSGIKWLSDTPNVSSKYPESEYLRCFIWAKLKDKTTGETYMFVNTHLDFAAASLKQTNKLLELATEMAGNIPVVFTADWNFYRNSNSAKAMNSAGYYTTESMSDNPHKPGTFGTSTEAIDFCFVDPNEFRTLDYKVIRDHKYSATASDHYAVISEIVPVKIYG